MIPFPLYFTTLQSNLQAGFTDFKREVGLYAGYGADSSLWTTDQAAELERDVNEGYRWILDAHTWNFKEQTTTLVTTADTTDYTLPVDFGSFIGQYMHWGANSGYTPPRRTHDGEILFLRSQSSTSGRPTHFALRWTAQVSGTTHRQEMILFPTPDAAYTLYYRYAVLAGKLSESNPYPIGGPRMTQLMFEACKAIGEAKKNGMRGDSWNVFQESLARAVAMDKSTNTPTTVGFLRGAQSQRFPQVPGESSYYFGPTDGSYTLEVV